MTDVKNDRMTIECDKPPNYDAICAAFPWVKTTRGILYAWGMTIWNPDGVMVTPSLMDHEQVHSVQQQGSPAAWWDKYLASAAFRYEQEVKAHIVEYANIYQHHPRNKRRLHLDDIAGRLAGPLYGHLTTKEAARRLLKVGAATLLRPETQEGIAA